jgi:threonyl-tRNA synthetase
MYLRLVVVMSSEHAVSTGRVRLCRAVLGSVERMMAILTEHYGGKWPLWLSPRQVMIVPISDKVQEYAQEVRTGSRGTGCACRTLCCDLQ